MSKIQSSKTPASPASRNRLGRSGIFTGAPLQKIPNMSYGRESRQKGRPKRRVGVAEDHATTGTTIIAGNNLVSKVHMIVLFP